MWLDARQLSQADLITGLSAQNCHSLYAALPVRRRGQGRRPRRVRGALRHQRPAADRATWWTTYAPPPTITSTGRPHHIGRGESANSIMWFEEAAGC